MTSIQQCLPGCSIYGAMHEPRGRLLRFTVASFHSKMAGKVLHRGKGVSFYALDHNKSIVLYDTTSSPFGQPRQYGLPIDMTWPLIVIPIPHYGVLCIDNLDKVPKGRWDEKLPEMGTLDFLTSLGKDLGETLFEVRKQGVVRRTVLRKKAIENITTLLNCTEKVINERQLQSEIIPFIEMALYGCDIYFGMIQPLTQSFKYTSSSKHSCMLHKSLSGNKTISYICFALQKEKIVECIESSNSTLEKFGGTPHGLFTTLPIPYLGVLSLDGYTGAASGRHTTTCPEEGVLSDLKHIARMYGTIITASRSKKVLSQLQVLVQGNDTKLYDVVQESMTLLSTFLLSVKSISVWEISNQDVAVCRYSLSGPEGIRRAPVEELGVPLRIDTPLFRAYQKIIGLENISDKIYEDVLSPSVLWWKMSDRFFTSKNIHQVMLLERWDDIDITENDDILFLKKAILSITSATSSVRNKEYSRIARKEALFDITTLCSSLEDMPASVAMLKLPEFQKNVVEKLACSMGKECTVYMGELRPGGTTLEYTATSSGSGLHGVVLSDPESISFNCMNMQENRVLNNLRTQYRTVHVLSKKKRIFGALLLIPLVVHGHSFGIMGTDCMDSSAFDLYDHLEKEVISYVTNAVKVLCESIIKLRLRYSCDTILKIKKNPKASLTDLYGIMMMAIRRDVLTVQSQQIVELATDYTGNYTTLAWDRSRTRRPLPQHVSHHCHECYCDGKYTRHGIHFEKSFDLPMTNLPKTLDEARSAGKGIMSIEKRGKVPCFSGLLDNKVRHSRVALIVYSRPHTEFGQAQLIHLKKIFKLATTAYSTILKTMLNRTLATQALYCLKDTCGANESAVLSILINAKLSSSKSPGVTCTTSSEKLPLGPLRSKGFKKVMHFLESEMNVTALDVTSSNDKERIDTYPEKRRVYEKARDDYTRKQSRAAIKAITKLGLKKKGAPKEPPLPPPRIIHLYLRISGIKDFRVAQVVFLTLHLKLGEDVQGYLKTAEEMVQKCRDSKLDYLLTNPRNVIMEELILRPLFLEAKNAFKLQVPELIEQVQKWVHPPADGIEPMSAMQYALLETVMCMQGYKRAAFKTRTYCLETMLKHTALVKFTTLTMNDRSSLANIIRGKASFADSFTPLKIQSLLQPPMKDLLLYETTMVSYARLVKSMVDKKKSKDIGYKKAAISIQRATKGYLIRALVRQERREKNAAMVIQKRYRRRWTSKVMYVLKRETAAKLIQKVFRKKYCKGPVGLPIGRLTQLKALNGHKLSVSHVTVSETFPEYLSSIKGRNELKLEIKRVHTQFKSLTKERNKMEIINARLAVLNDVFECFDPEGVGAISRSATKELINRLRIPLAENEMEDAIEMIDCDASGDISLQEFSSWYRYEYPSLTKRSKDCGSLSSKGKSWVAEKLATQTMYQKWHTIHLSRFGK